MTNGPLEIAATLAGLPLVYAVSEIAAKEPKSLLKQMLREMGTFMGSPGPRDRLLDVAEILFNTKGSNRTRLQLRH